MLAFSWPVLALRAEIASRIVPMRGICSILDGAKHAAITATIAQATVFGVVHLYQGATGVISVTISGLIFGAITFMARGAIRPAALAHGTNNSVGLIAVYSTGAQTCTYSDNSA